MKRMIIFTLLLLITFLIACGNEYSNEDSGDFVAHNSADFSVNNKSQAESAMDGNNSEVDQESEINIDDQQVRKVIYTADIHIEVKDYQKSINEIQAKLNELKGYVVDSSMYSEQEGQLKNGQMTVRVPQQNFEKFIEIVEEGSSRVIESSTSGQDVTEAYIDLESRLKSKRIVEERLTTFLEEAEKTEDLLKISNDLAKVQEEIEEITGKMNYLDNKTDLATITIYLSEKNVNLTNPGKDELNTWERTKQQFMKSTNFIITAFSNLFIFLIGNIPVIILLGIVVSIIIFTIKKLITKKPKE